MSGFAPPPRTEPDLMAIEGLQGCDDPHIRPRPHTGCCLIQRHNQGHKLQPWHHSQGCKNHRPAITVTSAMTGEQRQIEVPRVH